MSNLYLVTYPDYYHSDVPTMVLINTLPEERIIVQDWLIDNPIEMTIYLYNNENQIEWLLNVINQANNIYINVDNSTDLSYHYLSYMIGKPNTSWNSNRIDFSIINKGRVRTIHEFMEKQQLEK